MFNRRCLILAVVLVGFSAAVPSIALAGEPRTHDGFFLRLSAGGGSANTSIDDDSGEIDLEGGSGDVNIAIGGAIAPNLLLHGTIWGWSMSEPDADINIPGFGSFSGTLDGDVSMSGIGGGLTHYFMPINLYMSGSIGFGSITVDGGGLDAETDTGVVVDLSLGKEWWVGNSWGLGLAGGFSYHSVADGDIDENWSGTSFALRFSATMN